MLPPRTSRHQAFALPPVVIIYNPHAPFEAVSSITSGPISRCALGWIRMTRRGSAS